MNWARGMLGQWDGHKEWVDQDVGQAEGQQGVHWPQEVSGSEGHWGSVMAARTKWARQMVVKGLSVIVIWEWWVMKWVRQRDFRGA